VSEPIDSPADDPDPARVLRGNPTDLEIAAVTAVLSAMADELAAERGAPSTVARSAWDRSRRNLRTPIHPGPGMWRSFSA
jgi:hypothetical protein